MDAGELLDSETYEKARSVAIDLANRNERSAAASAPDFHASGALQGSHRGITGLSSKSKASTCSSKRSDIVTASTRIDR